MTRIVASALAVSAVFCLAVPRAEAQTAQDLVGTWALVSSTVQPGDIKVETFGPNPRGWLMFSHDGRYMLTYLRRDLPKVASDSLARQTADESQAIAQGSVSHFGTYSVDAANKTLVFRIESSTFPNWDGDEQRRPFSLSGDELTYNNPEGQTGFATQVVLRRLK